MMNILASPTSFLMLFIPFIIGGIGALILRKNDSASNIWGNIFAIIGSSWSLIFALSALYTKANFSLSFQPSYSPFFPISFHVDALSALFILIISLVAIFCSLYGLGYVKHFYKHYDIGVLGFFYNMFLASMLLVVSSFNVLFFLMVWEIMSITSYFLVSYERKNPENVKAGLLYFIMTHVGTACIILAFLILFAFTGSFDFATISAHSAAIPSLFKNGVFILAVIGFGMKAGIIPLHIWLPSAHPAAPSHVSALMSGVMIKTGIYMMIRLFLDIFMPIPLWWGLTLLIIGAVSALLGVLYALTEHNLKRLLAYHSIENIGIILLGLGASMTFTSLGMPQLATLSMVAALFHTANHAIFKSLLFLSAGSVINQTHTKNIEEYGGLIKRMPQTAFFFLIGAMAISALPPLNGFFSEWLIFQALFQGIAAADLTVRWIFIISTGALALTGGLALTCFVKAFGATFLARPRTLHGEHVKESSIFFQLGMGGLAILCIAFGVFSGSLSSILKYIAESVQQLKGVSSALVTSQTQTIIVGDNFSSASAVALLIALGISLFAVTFAAQYLIYRKQRVDSGLTWDCGTDLTPRMEITATGFSHSIIRIFKGILKPTRQTGIEYRDETSRYFPKSRIVSLGIRDAYQTYLYDPLNILILKFSNYTKKIQGGNINVYILYIFIALLLTLFFVHR